MSIATKRGDGGETGLAGGIRVSKASLRVETYGTVDELNSALGLARSMCDDADLRERTKRILVVSGGGSACPLRGSPSSDATPSDEALARNSRRVSGSDSAGAARGCWPPGVPRTS